MIGEGSRPNEAILFPSRGHTGPDVAHPGIANPGVAPSMAPGPPFLKGLTRYASPSSTEEEVMVDLSNASTTGEIKLKGER